MSKNLSIHFDILCFPYGLDIIFSFRKNFQQLSPRFGRRGREWKRMKRIILEYYSLPLFESFYKGNGKSISFFGSLSGREWFG